MLNWLKSLLKSLWRLLKKIWPILLVAGLTLFLLNPALFGAVVSWVGAGFSALISGIGSAFTWWTGLFEGLSFWEGAALAVGTAFLIDPEWAAKTISEVGSSVGTVVGAVAGGAAAGVLAGVTNSGILPWALGGLAIWLLLRKSDSGSERSVSQSEPPNDNQRGLTRESQVSY